MRDQRLPELPRYKEKEGFHATFREKLVKAATARYARFPDVVSDSKERESMHPSEEKPPSSFPKRHFPIRVVGTAVVGVAVVAVVVLLTLGPDNTAKQEANHALAGKENTLPQVDILPQQNPATIPGGNDHTIGIVVPNQQTEKPQPSSVPGNSGALQVHYEQAISGPRIAVTVAPIRTWEGLSELNVFRGNVRLATARVSLAKENLGFTYYLPSPGPGPLHISFRSLRGSGTLATDVTLDNGVSGYGKVQENPTYLYLETPQSGQSLTEKVRLSGGATQFFEGTFMVDIEDGHDVLARQPIHVNTDYRFDVTVHFNKPTNKTGAVLVYAYSPKDGSRIETLVLPVRFTEIQSGPPSP
ncbi:MAG: hypothetical protein IMW91_02805 [Firmicutes bacterium]|nr:hypothetical protein [Bacillota bacterium]